MEEHETNYEGEVIFTIMALSQSKSALTVIIRNMLWNDDFYEAKNADKSRKVSKRINYSRRLFKKGFHLHGEMQSMLS